MYAVGIILKWVVILSWRFLSGAHMNGETYNDATWWQDASSVYRKRRQSYTWWRRKARVKRASWRNCIFWPVALTTWAFIFYTSSAVIVLACFSPGLSYIAGRRIRLCLFLPIVASNSDGSVTQNWVLKPKVRRRWESVFHPRDKRKRPGLALDSELQPGIEYAELEEALPGQPSHELKLLMTPDDLWREHASSSSTIRGGCTRGRNRGRRDARSVGRNADAVPIAERHANSRTANRDTDTAGCQPVRRLPVHLHRSIHVQPRWPTALRASRPPGDHLSRAGPVNPCLRSCEVMPTT